MIAPAAAGRVAGGIGDPLGFLRGSLGGGLKDRDLRREGIIVGEGRLVAGRIAARLPLLAVVAEASAAGEAEALAADSERRFGRSCPVAILGPAEIAEVAGYPFHRGLLVAAERPLLSVLPESTPSPFRRLAVFPNPTDPENLGALVRSAAALGWDAALLGPGACDPFGRRALRCSMGSTLALPLYGTDAAAFGMFSERDDWTVVAAEAVPDALAAGSTEAGSLLRRAQRLALIFGNEHDGIPEAWRMSRTASVAIPQGRTEEDGVDSLNVAAAAAILLWEGRPGL